jgi:hypothetical protein
MIRRYKSGPSGAVSPRIATTSMAAMIRAEILQKRSDKSSDQITAIRKFAAK